MPEIGSNYVSLDGGDAGCFTTTMNHPRQRWLFLGLIVVSIVAVILFGTTLYYRGKGGCPVNPDHNTTTTAAPTTAPTTSAPTTAPTTNATTTAPTTSAPTITPTTSAPNVTTTTAHPKATGPN